MSRRFDRSERVLKEERFCTFARQLLDPLLQFRDNLRILVGKICLLGRIFRDVVKLQGRGQRRAPDQFPVSLPNAAAKWLDVVNNLMTR